MKMLSKISTRLFFFMVIPLTQRVMMLTAFISISPIFMSCGKSKAENNTATESIKKVDDTEIIAVKTVAVQTKSVVKEIVGTGMLMSKAESRLSFKTGGVISRIYVREGDDVKAGQLLATLDMTEINSQVAQAQLGVQKSERDLQRAKNLYADTVATLETVQNATTGADIARKTYEIAQFNQKFSEIRAPRSGKVLKKLMNQGELAGPGMPVFFINEATANTNDWVVRVGVSDRDWAALRVGNSTQISFDAYPNEKFTGRVSKLADMIDPASGTYEVEIAVETKGKRMAAGLFAHVKMQPSASSPMTLIPIEALVEGNGTEGFVWTLNADNVSVKKTPVKIIRIMENEIGVSGLTQNSVITEGSSYLTERTKVKKVE
jgi:membrane fusion protein, multidrug efflux system